MPIRLDFPRAIGAAFLLTPVLGLALAPQASAQRGAFGPMRATG